MYVESNSAPLSPVKVEYALRLLQKATKHVDEAEMSIARTRNRRTEFVADVMLKRADRSLAAAHAALGEGYTSVM